MVGLGRLELPTSPLSVVPGTLDTRREKLLSANICKRLRQIPSVMGDHQLGGEVKRVCTKMCTKFRKRTRTPDPLLANICRTSNQ
jgi:hypothetical protein